MDYYSLLGPLLRALPAETAHRAAILGLKHALVPPQPQMNPPSLRVSLWGLDFPNPVGMAAGFDKNAEAVAGLFSQGFGFVEAGTVTPLSQPGNPRPRMFRLREDEGIINRLGFNNEGIVRFQENLDGAARRGIVGINIGKNKDSKDAVADYTALLKAVGARADYITVNISSPNTAGLRDLQEKSQLEALIAALLETRAALPRRVPLLVKIAPDLGMGDKEAIAEVALAKGIDGLIVSNTTISRPESLRSAAKTEQGGLSGRPLFALSTETLRDVYRLTQGKLPLIGVGGIASGADAYAKIKAGASLVQLYSALVYQGFGLVTRIKRELAELLERDGVKELKEAVGGEA